MSRTLLLSASLLVVLVAGCRSDGPDAADTEGAAHEALGNLVLVTTRDYAFEAPDTIPAGWTTFRMVNHGPEYHHVQIFRVEGTRSSQELLAAMAMWRLPDWLVPAGGPEGADAEGVEVDATAMLEPGEYLLACRIHSPDGTEHFRKGMVRRLTVVPADDASDRAPPPEADLVLTLQDYAFGLEGKVRAGRTRIRVENRGPKEHHVAIGRLREGATLADAISYDPASGTAPPVEFVGGTSGLAPGVINYTEVTFEPGEYVLLCFVPDEADGRPHVEHGMARLLTVP
jgi:hypothetical protein